MSHINVTINGRQYRMACEEGQEQHLIDLALANGPQRGQALADQVLVGRELVVGQRLPVRKQSAAQAGQKEGDLVLQAAGIAGIGTNNGRDPPGRFLLPRQLGQ